jgi:lipoprotein-releasing system permease protein
MAMEMSGVLKTADNFRGLSFTGYSPEHDWRFLSAAIVDGKIPQFGSETGKDQLLISVNTADALGLKTGDKVDAYFFTDDNLRARRLEVAGTFNTNFIDHDRNKCFISLATLRRLAGISDNMAGRIEISHVDQAAIPGLTSHIEDGLYDRMITAKAKGDDCGQLSVDNVLHSAAVYFNWLNLLDTNVVVILILMACVAGFTLVSCLFILILERVRMIGALKAMGATGWQITRVFARLGMRIVAWGVIAGDILALGLATAQQRWAIAPLDPDVYYLSSVPVDITWAGIAAVNAGIVILSACIMLIPSRLIAGISPSSTMRYE